MLSSRMTYLAPGWERGPAATMRCNRSRLNRVTRSGTVKLSAIALGTPTYTNQGSQNMELKPSPHWSRTVDWRQFNIRQASRECWPHGSDKRLGPTKPRTKPGPVCINVHWQATSRNVHKDVLVPPTAHHWDKRRVMEEELSPFAYNHGPYLSPAATHLCDGQVRVRGDHGTCREVHTLAHQVASDAATLAHQPLSDGLQGAATTLAGLRLPGQMVINQRSHVVLQHIFSGLEAA